MRFSYAVAKAWQADLEAVLACRDEAIMRREEIEENKHTIEDKLHAAAHTCVLRADLAGASDVLEKSPALINLIDIDGCTLLMAAASSCRDAAIIKMLLKYGADPTARSRQRSNSPLHYACHAEFPEATNLLVEAHAALDARNFENATPLMLAAEADDDRSIIILLDKGADPNLRDRFGETALLKACLHGNEKAVTALLGYARVNLNIAGLKGQTPLHAACEINDLRLVSLLVSMRERLNLDAANELGLTPLFVAARYRRYDIIIYLTAQGASLRAGPKGFNLLHYAAYNGSAELFELALQPNLLDIHAETWSGETALALACADSHFILVRLLLERGARLGSKDDGGRTPLATACISGDVMTIRELLDHRADSKSQDRRVLRL